MTRPLALPDPLLTVIEVHRLAWEAVNAAPDDTREDAPVMHVEGAAYSALRVVRPITPEGLVGLGRHLRWFLDVEGERGEGTTTDHALAMLLDGIDALAPDLIRNSRERRR